VPDHLSGTASGVNNSAARIAGLLAVTLMGTIVNGVYRAALADRLPSGLAPGVRNRLVSNAGQLLEATIPESVSQATAVAVRASMESSFVTAYRAALAVALIAIAAAVVVAILTIRNDDPTASS
jgi:hypothetical protein